MDNGHVSPTTSSELHPPMPWYLRFRIAGGLTIVIIVASAIVAVGYAMYWNDGDRKYDIARGGEESENQALNVDDTEYDRTSVVDAQTVNKKLEFLQKEINALGGMGTFNTDDLSDQNLQLIPPNQPSF